MSNKQLAVLFICSLVPWTIGTGLLPLLPIFVTETGASQSAAGYFLAFCYAALAVGTVTAGWLSDRFQRRKQMVILSGTACIPILFFIGLTTYIAMGPSTDDYLLPRQVSAVIKLTGMGILCISMIVGGFFVEKLDKDTKSLLLIFGIILLLLNIFILSYT